MSTYETMRHFADSFGLVIMALVFLTLCAWPFRPGAQKHNRAAAHSIFEENDRGE